MNDAPVAQLSPKAVLEEMKKNGVTHVVWLPDSETKVGYRGWTRHGVTQDTAATYTERFLNAFGISYYLVESDADAARISVAFEEARKTARPVAVLIGDEYHGFHR
ncbi:MAG: hypothetical protein HYY79_07360 [Betaproteobacteria bacterium]|nr:hypothetical protein [Betaproteobacteria bacterium]